MELTWKGLHLAIEMNIITTWISFHQVAYIGKLQHEMSTMSDTWKSMSHMTACVLKLHPLK